MYGPRHGDDADCATASATLLRWPPAGASHGSPEPLFGNDCNKKVWSIYTLLKEILLATAVPLVKCQPIRNQHFLRNICQSAQLGLRFLCYPQIDLKVLSKSRFAETSTCRNNSQNYNANITLHRMSTPLPSNWVQHMRRLPNQFLTNQKTQCHQATGNNQSEGYKYQPIRRCLEDLLWYIRRCLARDSHSSSVQS